MKFTDSQDSVIRACWVNNKYGNNAVANAADKLGLLRSVVYRRAVALGLMPSRERYRWWPEEIAIVEKYAHLSVESLQKRLSKISPIKRTRSSIANCIYENRFRKALDGMNHTELSEALGVACDTLHKWREAKLITGKRLSSLIVSDSESTNAHWYYPAKQIRRFIFRSPRLFDIRKVQQLWFIELLRDGRDQVFIERDYQEARKKGQL